MLEAKKKRQRWDENDVNDDGTGGPFTYGKRLKRSSVMMACPLCTKKMLSNQIHVHCAVKHYKCGDCSKWFESADSHLYKCSVCLRSFNQCKNHLTTEHVQCDTCFEWILNQETLKEHSNQLCRLCFKTTCNIGDHLVHSHRKCGECDKWVLDDHQSDKDCKICLQKVCNIGTHLQKYHYKCKVCHIWYPSATDHPAPSQNCPKCKMVICDLELHKSIYVNCRDSQIVGIAKEGSLTSTKDKPKYVTVKCNLPDCPGINQCFVCYRYPFGALQKNKK